MQRASNAAKERVFMDITFMRIGLDEAAASEENENSLRYILQKKK